MHPSLRHLLDLLRLEESGSGIHEARGRIDAGEHLFGGQVLAQALAAAQNEGGGRLANSLHAYFLRRGDPRGSIRFEVESLRESRAFQTLQVTAVQDRRPILQMNVSFHEQESGPSHQIPMDDIGPPEGEVYEEGMLQAVRPAAWEEVDGTIELPVEIRGVGGLALFTEEVKPPNVRCWLRMRGEVPDDPALHQCLFAFVSDYVIFAPAVHPHPLPVTGYHSASLDHAIWFHRSFRVDEWLLFELDSPITANARGIGRGLLYTREGKLVASCVQEGLLRPFRERG